MISNKQQADIEDLFNPKHITDKVTAWLVSQPQIISAIKYGLDLYTAWLSMEHPCPQKQYRLAVLKGHELPISEILLRILAHVLVQAHDKTMLINIVMPLVSKLKFNDRLDSIQTAFELVALFSKTGIYSIFKMSVRGSLMISASIQLPAELLTEALNKEYMPPVLGKPKKLTDNNSTAYQSLKYSIFNGASINRHEGNACLDALNNINNVRFKLDMDFINNVTDTPDLEIKEKNGRFLSKDERAEIVRMKLRNHVAYTNQAKFMTDFINEYGGGFSFNHKIDKRGRIYSEGFIFNPQGSDYRKGQLNFEKAVEITVPSYFKDMNP